MPRRRLGCNRPAQHDPRRPAGIRGCGVQRPGMHDDHIAGIADQFEDMHRHTIDFLRRTAGIRRAEKARTAFLSSAIRRPKLAKPRITPRKRASDGTGMSEIGVMRQAALHQTMGAFDDGSPPTLRRHRSKKSQNAQAGQDSSLPRCEIEMPRRVRQPPFPRLQESHQRHGRRLRPTPAAGAKNSITRRRQQRTGKRSKSWRPRQRLKAGHAAYRPRSTIFLSNAARGAQKIPEVRLHALHLVACERSRQAQDTGAKEFINQCIVQHT